MDKKTLKSVLQWAAKLSLVAAVGVGSSMTTTQCNRAPVPDPNPNPAPAPSPGVDPSLAALGASYRSPLAHAKAEGWRAEATAILAGLAVADAQKAGQARFDDARTAAFETLAKATLSAILPEGSEPTASQRAAYAKALQDMASGLDDGRAANPDRGPPAPKIGPTGWVDDLRARRVLAAELPELTLSLAAPRMVASAGDDPKDVYLYRAWKDVLGAYPDYPAQQIGDCTSFGSSHALDLLQCIDISLRHGSKDEYRETSTEVTYGLAREVAGMLGTRSDGCYGVAVGKAVTTLGTLDRATVGPYSGKRAQQFGYAGVPADLKAKAKSHLLKSATLVTSLDEADAALKNGYPFIVCSNQGFTMTRDATGLCEARGHWGHCMFCAGIRYRPGRGGQVERQYLICQSWGPTMPSGPVADDQPSFSFWIREGVLASMLADEDSLAFSGFSGFVERAIPDRWTYSGSASRDAEAGREGHARPGFARVPGGDGAAMPCPAGLVRPHREYRDPIDAPVVVPVPGLGILPGSGYGRVVRAAAGTP